MEIEQIIGYIVNNGIGVVCVAYLIHFQNTTMKEMLKSLENINAELTSIKDKIKNGNN